MLDKNCLKGLTLERYTLGLHVIGVCGILRLAVVLFRVLKTPILRRDYVSHSNSFITNQ